MVVADTTFFKRTFGVSVLRSPQLKKNLAWQYIETETTQTYRELRWQLEKLGFTIQAAVMDGKPGIKEAFYGIPVQMCHFHQIAIMTRYLTSRPSLAAGQTLRQIAFKIPHVNEDLLSRLLDAWYLEWHGCFKDRQFRGIKPVYRSITRNLPLLYTYQKYPELEIPNTTNSLDGSFRFLKDMLRIHRGVNMIKKINLINEILSK